MAFHLKEGRRDLDDLAARRPHDPRVARAKEELEKQLNEATSLQTRMDASARYQAKVQAEARAKADADRGAQLAAEQRAKADAERRAKNTPELFPSGYALGFDGVYTGFRDLAASETSAWAFHGTLQLGRVDVALGAILSPETEVDAKIGLRVLAFPRPALSKVSLIGTVGLGVRSALAAEPVAGDFAWRAHATAKLRLSCGLLGTVSYEPALTDGAASSLAVGLELQLKYTDVGSTSVCQKL